MLRYEKIRKIKAYLRAKYVGEVHKEDHSNEQKLDLNEQKIDVYADEFDVTKNFLEIEKKNKKKSQQIFYYTQAEKRKLLRKTLATYRQKVDIWLLKWSTLL